VVINVADITTLDVDWFVYGLTIAGRYNVITVDGLEPTTDDVKFGELVFEGTNTSYGGDST
jgi:hypothetical protein